MNKNCSIVERVARSLVPNVSEKLAAFGFDLKERDSAFPRNGGNLFIKVHGATCNKTAIFIVSIVTSNLKSHNINYLFIIIFKF